MTSKEDDWTLLYRAQDKGEALQFQSALREAGVPVQLAGGQADIAFGALPDAHLVDVNVPTASIDKARRVIEALQAQSEELPSLDLVPAWTCTGCGEALSEGFTQCWSCGELHDSMKQ